MKFAFILGMISGFIVVQHVLKKQTKQCLTKVQVRNIESSNTNNTSRFTGVDNQLYEVKNSEYAVGDEICSDTITKVTK